MTGPTMEIGSSSYGDITNTGTNYSVPSVTTDGATGNGETWYVNTRWAQQLGYYKKIPELKNAINALATWTIGKGYQANENTILGLLGIRGFGKDSFNSILKNQEIVKEVGGDSYAEIIKKPIIERAINWVVGNEIMVNLKPLDPGTIRTVTNDKGIIIRYEQLGKTKKVNKTFQPEEIFHLSRDRVADEIHGESIIDAIEELILARNEAITDYRQVMHRYVKPRVVFKLDTDNIAKIAEFKAKADYANDKGENLYIPMGAAEFEILSVPIGGSMSPLQWIRELKNDFYEAAGVPQIVVGGSGEMTQAAAQIAYLAWEQTVEAKQLYLEEQVLAQLNIEIELEFPASLQNNLLSGAEKDGTVEQQANKPSLLEPPTPQANEPQPMQGGMA